METTRTEKLPTKLQNIVRKLDLEKFENMFQVENSIKPSFISFIKMY